MRLISETGWRDQQPDFFAIIARVDPSIFPHPSCIMHPIPYGPCTALDRTVEGGDDKDKLALYETSKYRNTSA